MFVWPENHLIDESNMQLYHDDNGIRLYHGDCVEILGCLPDGSVNCCVTSPPYWGLRDYGHNNQIGLESTPEAYVSKMVEVFREVRRVLRDDGTVWLNLGDSYGSGSRKYRDSDSKLPDREMQTRPQGFAKQLIGIPWRVAFALQADGWYLRQDIIWAKPNPMPESVRDRCTKAHEYIFLLAKEERYYYDADAVKEVSTYPKDNRAQRERAYAEYCEANARTMNPATAKTYPNRNRRSVWTVTPQPFKGAHFATFPPKLIEPCILAGCPEGGVVLDPFTGSGTTGMVARTHGRHFVGCELNKDYCDMAIRRITGS